MERQLEIEKQGATAGEIAKSMVNPWMAAAAAIALIVGALIYFKKEVKSTEELVTDLNKSIEANGKKNKI